ncbi:ribosomal protein L30, ferredoxin-like fold domain-containing protein [Sporodiniella umbellata]|nr:ribosomal protein L30, ferredoxin-like fold domain-containing protein [Sporodiniella umbellata]
MSEGHRNVANPIYVSENLLKKRKRNEKAAAEKAQERLEAKKKAKKARSKQFKRADEFVKDFRTKEQQMRRIKTIESGKNKLAKTKKGTNGVVFVARIKTEKAIHKDMLRALKNLRLTKMNSGVFVICDEKNMQDLLRIEPFVTYGKPSLKTIRELIMKRGSTQVEGKSTPLNNNAMIEAALGEHDVICLEDIIHEISTQGEHFTTVATFLEPFQLHNPDKGWRQKKLKDVMKSSEEESAEDDINKLVETMN